MITYSELFQFVIMLCAVITLVVTLLNHKKQRPHSGKVKRYFQSITQPVARLHLAFGSLVKYIITNIFAFFNYKLYVQTEMNAYSITYAPKIY